METYRGSTVNQITGCLEKKDKMCVGDEGNGSRTKSLGVWRRKIKCVWETRGIGLEPNLWVFGGER